MAGKSELISRGVELRDCLGAKANLSAYAAYAATLRIHRDMIGAAVEKFTYRPMHGDSSPHYDAARTELDQALQSQAAADPADTATIDRLLAENVEASYALKRVTRAP